MEKIIGERIQSLSEEMNLLSLEKNDLLQKIEEINVRMHQVAGALYELDGLINQASQLSELHQMQADLEASEKV